MGLVAPMISSVRETNATLSSKFLISSYLILKYWFLKIAVYVWTLRKIGFTSCKSVLHKSKCQVFLSSTGCVIILGNFFPVLLF